MIPHPLNPFGFENNVPLTLTAVETGTVELRAIGSPDVSGLHYRLGTLGNWLIYVPGTVLTLQAGKKVQFWNSNTTLSSNNGNYVQFIFSARIKASGNVMSLLNFTYQVANYNFYYLFGNCTTLLTPPDLSQVDRVSTASFYRMFRGCSSLTEVPKMPKVVEMAHTTCREMFFNCSSLTEVPKDSLPATSLTTNCYRDMFNGCTSLVNAPDLPATTLRESCYLNMFRGCTSLINAPTISATILADSCCNAMFYGCSSLINAPELKASALVENCYQYMFYGCTSLSSMNVNFTDWNVEGATTNWMTTTPSTGTFTKPSALEEIRGNSNIRTGWTINNK